MMTPRRYLVLISVLSAVILFLGYKKLVSSISMQTGRMLTGENKDGTNKKRIKFEHGTWTVPAVPDDITRLDQSDPRLAQYIRNHWILPPSTDQRKLTEPDKIHYSQRGQSKYVDKLLKAKTNGFYIECGAADGEALSNSLFFEKSRNWSGILIEANPAYFQHIVKIKRHAYMLNACLSPNRKPGVLDFRMAGFIGGLVNHMEPAHKARIVNENGEAEPVQIQCFPLLSILNALKITHVDYFSLDIEGAEYEILKDFPFDEIKVDVLTIEYVVSGADDVTRDKLKNITDLMIGRYGYKETPYRGTEDIMLSKFTYKKARYHRKGGIERLK